MSASWTCLFCRKTYPNREQAEKCAKTHIISLPNSHKTTGTSSEKKKD